jgi:hypothetical protein
VSERNYVIVCNEHKPIFPGVLLFWGKLTPDDAKRSYAGYTCQFDKCERYTREELNTFRGNLKKQYPFYDEIKSVTFFKHDEVLISIEELKKFGFREFHVMGR